MSPLRLGHQRVLGIAIGARVVEAAETAWRTRASPWSHPIEPLADGAVRWPSLTAALRDCRAARGRGAALAVALLPPLVDVRPLTLPPLAPDEIRRLIARNSTRYFLGAREPQVIGVAPLPRHAPSGPHTIMAAAASARLVEAIHAAAREAGWTLRTIVPAEAAWQAAALAIWPELHRGAHHVVVVRDDRTDLLSLNDGALVAVRRFGAAAAGLGALRDTLHNGASPPGTGTTTILGPAASHAALNGALSASASGARPVASRWSAVVESPARAAAAFAALRVGFEFLPESLRHRQQARRTRRTVAVAVAAGVLLVVAAGLQWWGIQRELRYVDQERTTLRPQVATLLATRDLAASAGRRLHELASPSPAVPPWSDVIAQVTTALPHTARLTTLRAEGDSVVLDGLADHAADVLTALAAVPGFTAVRSAAPVRRDLRDRDAANVQERFSLAAHLAPPLATDDPSDSTPTATAARP